MERLSNYGIASEMSEDLTADERSVVAEILRQRRLPSTLNGLVHELAWRLQVPRNAVKKPFKAVVLSTKGIACYAKELADWNEARLPGQTDSAGRNIAADEKWVFEVRNGVILIFDEQTKLADGWWFSTNSDPFGPFATDQEALDAASEASNAMAELNLVMSPGRRRLPPGLRWRE